MNAKKPASRRSLKSDLARVNAHATRPEDGLAMRQTSAALFGRVVLPYQNWSADLARRARFQHFHRWQFLAFEELEECAARGRDVADVLGHAKLVDGGDGIAAARDR